MSKIAIIKTGGKQYLVEDKTKLKVEKIAEKNDSKVMFDVLLASDSQGKELKLGNPILKEKAEAKVLLQGRAKKIRVVHYKNKTRQHKEYGHRQPYTQVEISKIG